MPYPSGAAAVPVSAMAPQVVQYPTTVVPYSYPAVQPYPMYQQYREFFVEKKNSKFNFFFKLFILTLFNSNIRIQLTESFNLTPILTIFRSFWVPPRKLQTSWGLSWRDQTSLKLAKFKYDDVWSKSLASKFLEKFRKKNDNFSRFSKFFENP